MITILKFTNRYNSIKNVSRVMVLDVGSFSNDALYLYQTWFKYLKAF